MTQYSIKFIGRNAYISDASGESCPIISMDFKSIIAGSKNGTTLDTDPKQPLVIVTEGKLIKIFPEDALFITVDQDAK